MLWRPLITQGINMKMKKSDRTEKLFADLAPNFVLSLLMLALLVMTGCSDHAPFTGITPTPQVRVPAAPTGLAVTAGGQSDHGFMVECF
jgi:hypothetical protein